MIENKIKSRRDYKIYSNSIGFEYFLNFLDHFDVSVEILNSTKVRYRVSLNEVIYPVFCRKFYSIQSKVKCNIINCNVFNDI